MKQWTDADFAIALEMLARGDRPAAFLERLGRTKKSAHSRCERMKCGPPSRVYVRREDQTPEYREMMIERRRIRQCAKDKRRNARIKAAKLAASPLRSVSKTNPVTRARLYGRVPEMTKNELRAVIAQAVRNTAEMAL